VEFKKTSNYSNGRPRLTVPQRGAVPVAHAPVQHAPQSAPVRTMPATPTPPVSRPARTQDTHPRPRTAQKTAASRARHFILSHKKVTGLAVILVTGLIIIGASVHQNNVAKNIQNTDAHKIINNPGYQTVLPDGVPISTLGGWERVSPVGSDPVYAFNDKIAGTPISVSEQPLPKTFEGEVGSQVAELAKKFNATNKISAGDTTVYLGTSAKGPQSAIFIKINLLVLIKSQSKISDDAWIKYVKALN